MSEAAEDPYEDTNDVPLHQLKPFGSGLRRTEIKFVPASSDDPAVADSTNGRPGGQSIRELYLNMVLKKPEPTTEPSSHDAEPEGKEVCEICKLPLTSTSTTRDNSSGKSNHHEASIAHQVCLTHSHPPSAVDRNRMGLSVLEAAGWDPDARTGLGAAGQGVQYPVKVKPKEDKLGIGVVVPNDFVRRKKTEAPKLLDAKKVRKMAAEDRKRTDKLQQQIFGRVDLEKYLGKGA